MLLFYGTIHKSQRRERLGVKQEGRGRRGKGVSWEREEGYLGCVAGKRKRRER